MMLRIRTHLSKIFVRSTFSTTATSSSTCESQKGKLSLKKDEIEEPLTDAFGRCHTYLRISLTERCNLRCTYCMPEEGVSLVPGEKLLTTSEILFLADLFVRQGVTKIRLTGGEPTIRKDLPEIISGLKKFKGLTQGVSITTNGLMLTKQLVDLQRAGLDGLNVSLDTLKPEKFKIITRRKGWERVMAGVDLALQLGYDPVKINCVLVKGVNDDEIVDFVDLTKNRKINVRFIEYMPFDGNQWAGGKFVPYKDVVQTIKEAYPNLKRLTDGPNDTSKAYKVPGHDGQIGFITSMSENFCGSCNRLRLTADGNLKVCLFGNTEISLRDAIRNRCSESDLLSLISAAVKRKKKQHAVENFRRKIKIEKQLLGGFVSHSRGEFHGQTSQRVRKYFNQGLTHVDDKGNVKMVDIGSKEITKRTAVAEGLIQIGPVAARSVRENNLKKGDVFTVVKLAGITGAKKTSELIPLCHNIALNNVSIEVTLKDELMIVRATVTCDGKTGVEMEALTAVSIAALTVYDMCKAISHDIAIKEIKLLKKTGGTSGDFSR